MADDAGVSITFDSPHVAQWQELALALRRAPSAAEKGKGVAPDDDADIYIAETQGTDAVRAEIQRKI